MMFLIFCLALYLFVLKLLSFKASKSFNHSHMFVSFFIIQCASHSAESCIPDQSVSRLHAASKDDSAKCKYCAQLTPRTPDLECF